MTKNLSKIPRFVRNDIGQFILSFTIKKPLLYMAAVFCAFEN